ncbi:alpha/beta hydrolase [Buttiauxella sp.]|uniref:alpha/beta hydrolase n=1 Tax=Buttiauxella sp. TaxID=1972222 RepID=UPI003C77B142
MSIKTAGLSRRNFILTSSVASAGLLMAGHASALLSPTPNTSGTTTHVDGITVSSVLFRNNEIMMSGNIYVPPDFSENRQYAAIVVVHPGSGITIKASMTERRVKALATVSAVDVGAATRKGWEGTTSESELIPTLEAVAKQRTVEATGGALVYVNYVPKLGDTSSPKDLQEAAEYYLTERGKYPTSTNQMLMTSISTLASFTGFEGADVYLTQPLLIVAGSKAGSLWHSQELHNTAASVQKTLHIIPGATHMDLYDGQGATVAASQLVPFFKNYLAQV